MAVTVIMGVIVGLTFMFGFGNVLSLGLRLGVSGWVAPLVAPAVDLSVLALLLATRHLAVHGASMAELRPARRLLMFSSVVTLALNVADPLLAGEWGKAAFDAVGSLLLIGWAHVGPDLLHALSRQTPPSSRSDIADNERIDSSQYSCTEKSDNAEHEPHGSVESPTAQERVSGQFDLPTGGHLAGRYLAVSSLRSVTLPVAGRHVLPGCRSVIVRRPLCSRAWSAAHRTDRLDAAPPQRREPSRRDERSNMATLVTLRASGRERGP